MVQRHPVLRCVHHWPTRCLCISLTLLQAVSTNWYLIHHLGSSWSVMFALDACVVAVFIWSFSMAASNIQWEKRHRHAEDFHSKINQQPLTYIGWIVYALVLCFKFYLIFAQFSTHLHEGDFFGPNTCKTSLGISGLVFITFLYTQHDVREGERKALVLSLTSQVLVDLLDIAEYLDNLFREEERKDFLPGLDYIMIFVCCINLLLPALPLFTLSRTKFGLHPLPVRLERLHKIGLAYLVNLPLFVTRMILWHGLSQGISIFTLKNLVIMSVVTFQMLERWYTEDKQIRLTAIYTAETSSHKTDTYCRANKE